MQIHEIDHRYDLGVGSIGECRVNNICKQSAVLKSMAGKSPLCQCLPGFNRLKNLENMGFGSSQVDPEEFMVAHWRMSTAILGAYGPSTKLNF